MKTLTRIRAKKRQIESIARHYGIRDIRIFGSVARGEETRRSDIDMLVKYDRAITIPEVCDAQDELAKLLGRPVQLVARDELGPILRQRVPREAVPL